MRAAAPCVGLGRLGNSWPASRGGICSTAKDQPSKQVEVAAWLPRPVPLAREDRRPRPGCLVEQALELRLVELGAAEPVFRQIHARRAPTEALTDKPPHARPPARRVYRLGKRGIAT